MSCLILELNDSGIGIARDRELFAPEPGYALRDGKNLTLGVEALARARVNPQSVTDRFWDTLDQDTLPDEGRWRQTPAELAFAQLEAIWVRHKDASEAMIVVPGCYTRAQLGLILGMCRKASIPLVSLIDSAVAALASPPAGQTTIYLDLTLHRVLATRCRLDGVLIREEGSDIDQLGLNNFLGKWAACVADACVRATRYDPMHSAAAEQQLYDSLPGLLDDLVGADSVTHVLNVNDEELEVVIPRASFEQAAKPFYARIVGLVEELADGANGGINVVLSHRYSRFPGLRAALADVKDWMVTALPADAALLGVAEDLPSFTQPADSIGLVVERPVAASSTVVPQAPARQAAPPSHILVDGDAFVLHREPFVVGTATRDGSWGYRASGAVKGVSRSHCSIYVDGDRVVVRDHSTFGTYVNGQRIDGERRLGAGDVVRVGNPGVELRLVREVVWDG